MNLVLIILVIVLIIVLTMILNELSQLRKVIVSLITASEEAEIEEKSGEEASSSENS